MIGKTLGHYQITEKLGEGGMGVVFKARDTHLARFVALKVLPPEKVADPDRKRRFVQEAKAASALNHPNIVHVYDIDQSEGTDYIAMEYVDGKTLDQRIGHRGLRLNDTLKYAVQIADALAKAHSAGIVHRDLKPTNIVVNEDGVVKVLDFGLAKLTEQVQGDQFASTATVDDEGTPITEEGVIVGTVSYMSPEQAEGEKVDARSDIFSLGSVLYEMVSGQKAFQGTTKMSTLSAILHQEPKPVSGITPTIPPDLEKLINRCLRKDPAKRYQHMDDVKVALSELSEEIDSGRLPAGVPELPRERSKWMWVAGVAAALLILVLGAWRLRVRLQEPPVPLEAVPLTSYPGSEIEPTLSPEGAEVAFAWDGDRQDNFDIYRKLIGPGPPLRLTTSPMPERSPAWSPDGKWIAFERYPAPGKAEFVLIPALGGPERKVAEAALYPPPEGVQMPALAWSPDSNWLAVPYANLPESPGLVLLSIRTGEKRQVTEGSDFDDVSPSFSPDGRSLAFVRVRSLGVADLYVARFAEGLVPQGKPEPLTTDHRWPISPVWTADGRNLLFTTGELMAGRALWEMDAAGGNPRLVPGIGDDGQAVALSQRPGATSRLVYSRAVSDVNIWAAKVDRDRQPVAASPLIKSTYRDLFPAFSPDGTRIAFSSDRSGSGQIWTCDRDGANAVQLTSFGHGVSYWPTWSPDGGRIVFASRTGGEEHLYTISVTGGTPQRLTRSRSSLAPAAFSPDGKWIYFRSSPSEPEPWKAAADDPDQATKIHLPVGLNLSVSPDGRFLYYSNWQAHRELWRVPLDANGDPAGHETLVVKSVYPAMDYAVVDSGVYYIAAPLAGGQPSIDFFEFATGRSREILKLDKRPFQGFTATRDGRHALWAQVDQSGSDLMLVENFR